MRAVSRRGGTAVAAVAALFLVFLTPSVALAAAPSNDDFDNATLIENLPFSDNLDTREAAAAADDPTTCTNNGSVWYRFTPSSDTRVVAETSGSGYATALSVYTGSRGVLEQVPGACNDYPPRVVFNATANTTYYFLVGICCGHGGTGGGDLAFSVTELEAPDNDDFGNAARISALPFSDTVDISGATRQTGEPTAICGNPAGTVWYAFTPAETGSITAAPSGVTWPLVAAYTGSSLADLREVGCRAYWGRLTFRATAGQTYYFQVGSLYGGGGPLRFDLDVAPEPQAAFGFYPSDPSTYDTVQFYDQSYDPGEVGIASQAWDFGDGGTATGSSPSHRFAADGDYTVRLTVTTSDGRTASTSQIVPVRTHDVAITKILAPESANAGQTRQISAEVKNTRYPETVRVEFFKSDPTSWNGFRQIGSLTQSVPVRPANRTTSFAIIYTFTGADAAVGKVTFKAIATLEGARDALPADNEAISSPTKVSR
jgi:PKD repeat protein